MLAGSCHCGGTQETLEGDPGSITACNCTLCRRYGVLWASDYVDVRIRVSGPMAAAYRLFLRVRFTAYIDWSARSTSASMSAPSSG